MSPRPILKRTSASYEPQSRQQFHQPHQSHSPQRHQPGQRSAGAGVRFPPSPSLTRTFSALPPAVYDRSPIVVAPNTCALPERGCPGRTYMLDEVPIDSKVYSHSRDRAARAASAAQAGHHPHPRALGLGLEFAGYDDIAPPPLVPDLSSSSESDESDGFISPPPESYAMYSQPAKYPSIPSYFSQDDVLSQPLFTPPTTRTQWSPKTNPLAGGEEDPGYDDDTEVPPSSTPTPGSSVCWGGPPSPTTPTDKAKRRTKKRGRGTVPTAGFGDEDGSGCLGGF